MDSVSVPRADLLDLRDKLDRVKEISDSLGEKAAPISAWCEEWKGKVVGWLEPLGEEKGIIEVEVNK
ncbi:MAG TPA: hypothetical protein VJL07_02600 [Dehalococcoidia bacterium]|nr:hypothetical protein [Dehalococcoidia bacterium]